MRLVTVLFLALSSPCFSQFVTVPMTIRTPQGNVNSSYQMYQPMHYYHNNATKSLRYEFKVTLKNDSSFKCVSRIDFSKKNHFIKVKKGKEKELLYPQETKNIETIPVTAGFDDAKVSIQGLPTDSCWLFKTIKSKINCYSFLPVMVDGPVVAIQQGDGPILPVTKDNVLYMVVDADERTMKLINKGKLVEAVFHYNESNK